MKKATFLAAGLALMLLAGCAPEEEEVCKHLIQVYGDDADRPGYLDSLDQCVESYQGKKSRRGVNSYRREVECILGSDTVYQIRRCVEKENKRQ